MSVVSHELLSKWLSFFFLAGKMKFYLQVGNEVAAAPVRAVSGLLWLQVGLALPPPHIGKWVFPSQRRAGETRAERLAFGRGDVLVLLDVCKRKTQGEIRCCIGEKYLLGENLHRTGSSRAPVQTAFLLLNRELGTARTAPHSSSSSTKTFPSWNNISLAWKMPRYSQHCSDICSPSKEGCSCYGGECSRGWKEMYHDQAAMPGNNCMAYRPVKTFSLAVNCEHRVLVCLLKKERKPKRQQHARTHWRESTFHIIARLPASTRCNFPRNCLLLH